jgi:hypothetical protein
MYAPMVAVVIAASAPIVAVVVWQALDRIGSGAAVGAFAGAATVAPCIPKRS